MPTLRPDVGAHVAVHEQCVSVWSPRSAEIDLGYSGVGRKAAVIEYVAVGAVFGC